MFYFYGRKKRIINLYPKPIYDLIIEPFAGSAAYSIKYGLDRDVILLEKDERVYKLWRWLQSSSEDEILSMPNLKQGEITNKFIHILHSASKRAFGYKNIKVTEIIEKNWNSNKLKIAKLVGKIKHWDIRNCDYSNVRNYRATWFIDPPYIGEQGTGYFWNSDKIDYHALSKWIKNRIGQAIACEGNNADYLKFIPLVEQSAINGKKNKELLYYKIN